MKYLILFIITLLSVVSCVLKPNGLEEIVVAERDSVRMQVSQLVNRFDLYGEQTLDSAIKVIDNFYENDAYLCLQKAFILSRKEAYLQGLEVLCSLNDSLFNPPLLKRIYTWQFETKIVENYADVTKKNVVLQQIVDTISSIVPQSYIDSIISSDDPFVSCDAIEYLCITTKYSCLEELYGRDSIRAVLYEKYNSLDSSRIFSFFLPEFRCHL